MIDQALNNPVAVLVIAMCASMLLITIAAVLAPKRSLPPMPDAPLFPEVPLRWDDETAEWLAAEARRRGGAE